MTARLAFATAAGIALATGLVAPAARARAPQTVQEITPAAGQVIDRSVRVAPGTYRLAAPGPNDAALIIRGDGITVDLRGVTLEGGDPAADPDGYQGVGILVENSRQVTIRGGLVRGYKVAVLGRRAPQIHITGLDASYNWKPRLYSGIERESLLDWLTYHDNDNDEWLRYGAAIYLSESNNAEVDNSRAVQGQNGLMVVRSSGVKVWNNTFAWMSGLGIGMYRTTDSRVLHNRLDWNVRGFSDGFYRRGQDSAGLLMYEQSSRNTVAYNSVTHGGDGLFLWAGQTTMDNGLGGSNDNVFFGNDFSHAVANGIEATFSRNLFIRNRIDDCWHGVWAGYSHDTAFRENTFAGNEEAIAIEHGQDITIAGNTFTGDPIAIRIWANPTQDPNWGYPKNHDTRSRDYLIQQNTFTNQKTAIQISRTASVRAQDNAYVDTGTPLQIGTGVSGLLFEPPGGRSPLPALLDVPRDPAGTDAMLPAGARRGRGTIVVDEWGPYDYQYPRIWPSGRLTDRPVTLRVLGPPGQWTLASIAGGQASVRSGPVPGELTVTPSGRGANVLVDLEYVGEATMSPRGDFHPAGDKVPFSYAITDPAIDWDVRWWTFDAASHPMAFPDDFAARLKADPVKRETLSHLGFLAGGSPTEGLPADGVTLRAEGSVQVPAGGYDLQVLGDDGVRIWVDGALVVDRWAPGDTSVHRVRLSAGGRRLRVDYFELTGWAELQVSFIRPRP